MKTHTHTHSYYEIRTVLGQVDEREMLFELKTDDDDTLRMQEHSIISSSLLFRLINSEGKDHSYAQ